MKGKAGVFRPGEAAPRIDASAKTRGVEKYAADYYSDNFLWAGAKRAGIPHGLLRAIHTENARRMPGVTAVLNHKDIPGAGRIGLIYKDQPVLADTKILHGGDPIALVLAESKDTLKNALHAITFDYEPLPAIFDAEEALTDHALQLHEDHPDGNLIRVASVEKGNASRAFTESDIIVEGVFEVPSQEHAYLETEAGWAYHDEAGRLVIIASTQTPFRDRFEIAPVLGIDPEMIRVIAPYLGGAFGGKDGNTVQCLLGLAALHSGGRPVKMWWDREESFLAGVKRLSARMYYRLGATAGGEFTALDCRLYFNGGPYAGLGGEVMTLGAEHAGSAYRIPNVTIKGFCVYTNGPLGGPFRGFGVPQTTAAIEQMVDMAAQRIDMDPILIRLKNAVRKGDANCLGITLTHSTGAKECLDVLAGHPLWKEKDRWKNNAAPFKIRGIGVACTAHAMGFPPIVPDQATAKIELTRAGKIRVYAGVVDMGQGNAGTYMHIASALLNQQPSAMELVLPDTDKTLPCGSSTASRTTYTYGNALVEAAGILRKRMIERTAETVPNSIPEEFDLVPGCIIHIPSGKEFPLADVADLVEDEERVCTAYFRMPTVQEKLDVIYMGPHLIFSYGAGLAYVEIDTLTGAVEVKAYVAATDAGRVLNPQLYEQQIQGGVAQGIGYALTEDFKISNGSIVTGDLSTYIIPTSMDISDMISVPVETDETTGPFGLKGVGEISMSGVLPAISNAIADGCGKRIFNAPFTGEKVLAMIEGSANRSPVASAGNNATHHTVALPPIKHAPGGEKSFSTISFILNGTPVEINADPFRRVVDILREDLLMTGTKEGCGSGECGACTILVDGKSRLSCLMLAAQLEGRSITTIEGLSAEGRTDPVQDSFIEHGAVQCGFCTPGMIMAAKDFLQRNASPDRNRIREGISGNLCRCTGYQKIVDAVEAATGKREEQPEE